MNATLADYLTNAACKILVLGHSGTGKTCLLLSLLRAGYGLAIVDLESKMAPLAQLARARGLDAEMAHRTSVQTLVQPRKVQWYGSTASLVTDGVPSVWPRFQQLLGNWPGAGPIENFGSDVVLVIDSLSALSDAAYDHLEVLNTGSRGQQAHGLQVTGKAQDALINVLDHLCSASVRCHVVIIGHLQMTTSIEHGTKYWAEAPGQKLGPKIPRKFDYVIQTQPRPIQGQLPAYEVNTAPTVMMDLKVPGGGTIPPTLPSDVALAYLIEAARGAPGPSGLSALHQPQAFGRATVSAASGAPALPQPQPAGR